MRSGTIDDLLSKYASLVRLKHGTLDGAARAVGKIGHILLHVAILRRGAPGAQSCASSLQAAPVGHKSQQSAIQVRTASGRWKVPNFLDGVCDRFSDVDGPAVSGQDSFGELAPVCPVAA